MAAQLQPHPVHHHHHHNHHHNNHHVSCSSTSSQVPLIQTNGDCFNGTSERSTPISIHSLQFSNTTSSNNNSNSTTTNLSLANKAMSANAASQQQQQQHQLATTSSATTTTPLLPSSANISSTSANIFFTPITPRTTHNQQHNYHSQLAQQQQNLATCEAMASNGTNKSQTVMASSAFKQPPNAAHERNGEQAQSRPKLSPSRVAAHDLSRPNSGSSKLNSPMARASPFRTTFFPDTNPFNNSAQSTSGNHSLSQDTSHISPPLSAPFASRRSVDLKAPSIERSNKRGNDHSASRINDNIIGPFIGQNCSNNTEGEQQQDWSTQADENYHLYHEPIDLDEQINLLPKNSPPTKPISNNALTIIAPIKTHKSGGQHCPPPLNLRHLQNSSSRNWSLGLPSTPTKKSPPSLPSGSNNSVSSPSQKISASHSARLVNNSCDKNQSKHQNDVSADIYFCYVTLKSNERASHRSRSYHGPKNATISHRSQADQPPHLKDATKNLSSTSVSELPLSSPSTMVPNHFRDCLRELIDTESNYVHALDMIIHCFAKPLEPFFPLKEHSQFIFGHIRYFHQVHSSFQANLRKAAARFDCHTGSFNSQKSLAQLHSNNQAANSNPSTPTTIVNFSQQFQNLSPLPSPTVVDPPHTGETFNRNRGRGGNIKISTCFLNVKEKFLKYGEYCATLSKIQALLDDLSCKNEAIATELDRCQQEANEEKFKLRDLLSLPMQRILKYHLLLNELIRNTNSKDDDYVGLKRAYEAMVDLGHYINEVKRDTEAIQIINEIERSITGLNMPSNTQLIDYGRLVIDGRIRVKFPHDSRAKTPYDKRYIIVFDKVMLICKEEVNIRGRRYSYKEALVLSEYEMDTTPVQIEILAKQTLKDKYAYNFSLVRSSDRTSYSFFAKTVDLKNRWVDALNKAFDNIRPAVCRNNETNHDFLMHTFEEASSCDHCGKLLLGLYYQGYRCRICFASAHKKCLASLRRCGSGSALMPRNQMIEPPSPSIRSNCSDEGTNTFRHFPTNLSSSTSCVDVMAKNEYSNIESRLGAMNLSSSLRDKKFKCESDHSVHDTSTKENDIARTNACYENFILNKYSWFSGRMERDRAQTLLEGSPNGTFLVRVSPKHNGSYVISLSYNNQVKHMRIFVSKDNQLYLSQNRYFNSIIDLVSWYQKNSLVECFHMLDARLAIPFKDTKQ